MWTTSQELWNDAEKWVALECDLTDEIHIKDCDVHSNMWRGDLCCDRFLFVCTQTRTFRLMTEKAAGPLLVGVPGDGRTAALAHLTAYQSLRPTAPIFAGLMHALTEKRTLLDLLQTIPASECELVGRLWNSRSVLFSIDCGVLTVERSSACERRQFLSNLLRRLRMAETDPYHIPFAALQQESADTPQKMDPFELLQLSSSLMDFRLRPSTVDDLVSIPSTLASGVRQPGVCQAVVAELSTTSTPWKVFWTRVATLFHSLTTAELSVPSAPDVAQFQRERLNIPSRSDQQICVYGSNDLEVPDAGDFPAFHVFMAGRAVRLESSTLVFLDQELLPADINRRLQVMCSEVHVHWTVAELEPYLLPILTDKGPYLEDIVVQKFLAVPDTQPPRLYSRLLSKPLL
ncbi:MAG: hypothetical protein KVP17_001112 [Porospora cf. gigantea B]|uniref:uncharacterized protein n=1 Tax=Porospora cf. gigantea B TaxID=2853592 RepID=UPI003571C54F|nr:MAG: hypothetical protein KVP17_001112 [Porospora cf. gigantea B]